ncbi:MAG: hypothetical protein HGA28_00045 [Anaerolineaceae bacterium]|nr:hypothetical protein [Anaerolineaceae bacterium]
MTIKKWGAIGFWFMALSFVVPPFIYLTGNLRDRFGAISYDLADLLYGPILSASIVIAFYSIREHIGRNAFRRMDLALISAALSALGMVALAFLRASNRHYHILHPDLNLESSTTVLVVWTTLATTFTAVGFHFLGWTFILTGSSIWSSRIFPRLIAALFIISGIPALFMYIIPEFEGFVSLFGVIIGVWQGILLWRQKDLPI